MEINVAIYTEGLINYSVRSCICWVGLNWTDHPKNENVAYMPPPRGLSMYLELAVPYLLKFFSRRVLGAVHAAIGHDSSF
jgi:hypothetical protein